MRPLQSPGSFSSLDLIPGQIRYSRWHCADNFHLFYGVTRGHLLPLSELTGYGAAVQEVMSGNRFVSQHLTDLRRHPLA